MNDELKSDSTPDASAGESNKANAIHEAVDAVGFVLEFESEPRKIQTDDVLAAADPVPDPATSPATESASEPLPETEAAPSSPFSEPSFKPTHELDLHLVSSSVGDAIAESAAASSPAAAGSYRIKAAALSDMGCVRTNNEDAFGYDEDLGIFVVCDGMGGMASGEVASAHAVAAMVNTYANSAQSGLPVSARMLEAITAANADVWENGQLPENRGMGTTAVAAALDHDKLVVCNVGDSRAYVLQDGRCSQLTVDHSYLNELIRNGTVSIENAHNVDLQGMENVITRAVGASADVEADFFSVELKPGMGLLLASDGLTRYLKPDEISTLVQASTFETACSNLIDIAKQRGGHDNITCVLLVAFPN